MIHKFVEHKVVYQPLFFTVSMLAIFILDAHNILYITANTHQAEAYQQGEDGGRDWTGIINEPEENARLHMNGEQRNVCRHGEYKG